MSESFRDGVFCGLGLAIGAIQDLLDDTTDPSARKALRAARLALGMVGTRWDAHERKHPNAHHTVTPLSEEVTPA